MSSVGISGQDTHFVAHSSAWWRINKYCLSLVYITPCSTMKASQQGSSRSVPAWFLYAIWLKHVVSLATEELESNQEQFDNFFVILISRRNKEFINIFLSVTLLLTTSEYLFGLVCTSETNMMRLILTHESVHRTGHISRLQ